MSWWKRSKYKQPEYNNWYEQPDEEVATHAATPYYGSRWGGYVWKPKYDMSVGLETRVTQLIKTVTGKTLKLQQAEGWGNNGEYFFYNPADLQDVTDDEVLGRILQQLAGQLYGDPSGTEAENKKDERYRHLLNNLEINRADRQLAKRYPGTAYYADELWQNRKFTDSPFTKYTEKTTFEQWIEPQLKGTSHTVEGYLSKVTGGQMRMLKESFEQTQVPGKQNDAWEFCFNLHAFQNKEENFDFSKDKLAADFTKALPLINEYLEAPTLAEALVVYPKIKPFYPIPSKEEQKQMDSQGQATQGLSQGRIGELTKALAEQKAQHGHSENAEDDHASFIREFANDNTEGFWNESKRHLETYRKYQAAYQAQINTLFNLLRSILKDNAIKRFVRPFKRGKIDGKAMYKYLATDNLRIFKKPRVVNDKDYLMTIVIDMSGSMRGTNSHYACQGAIVMAEVLEKLKIPYEMLAYNSQVYTIKGFKEVLKKELLPIVEGANGDNNELAVIKTLTRHITKFDPSNYYRKGVFWITDGEAYAHEEVKRMVTKLEHEHRATVFAIGIGSDIRESSLRSTYNHYINIEKVSELPTTLVSLMRGQFKRG